MSKFKSWLFNFMYGRNGADALYRFTLAVCILLAAFNIFLQNPIVWLFETALLIWAVFRCFSRNVSRRQAENQRYLKTKGRVIQFFRRQKNRIKYRKTKVYKKCPNCKSILCLPRKKGSHTVKCPSCEHRFDVHI